MCLHYIYMCFRHAGVYGVYGVLNYAFIFLGRQRGLLAEFWVGFQDVILLFHPKTSPSCINCHHCRLKTPVYWRILWLCSISFLLCLCEDLVIYGCYSSEILSRCCLFLMINVLNPQCLPLCLEGKKSTANMVWLKHLSMIHFLHNISAWIKSLLKPQLLHMGQLVVCERRLVLAVDRINNYLTSFVLHSYLSCGCICLRQLRSSFSACADRHWSVNVCVNLAATWTRTIRANQPLTGAQSQAPK